MELRADLLLSPSSHARHSRELERESVTAIQKNGKYGTDKSHIQKALRVSSNRFYFPTLGKTKLRREKGFSRSKRKGFESKFFSGWEKVIAAFEVEKQKTLGREIQIGDSWFHQQLVAVPETGHVQIYVSKVTASSKLKKDES